LRRSISPLVSGSACFTGDHPGAKSAAECLAIASQLRAVTTTSPNRALAVGTPEPWVVPLPARAAVHRPANRSPGPPPSPKPAAASAAWSDPTGERSPREWASPRNVEKPRSPHTEPDLVLADVKAKPSGWPPGGLRPALTPDSGRTRQATSGSRPYNRKNKDQASTDQGCPGDRKSNYASSTG
jgi:hypothetical protein